MDIIAIITAGFLLLIFIIIFQKRSHKRVEKLLKQNRNVEPLFEQTAAKNKYQALYTALKHLPEAYQQLLKLHQDFNDKKISVEVYVAGLDRLEEQYLKVNKTT